MKLCTSINNNLQCTESSVYSKLACVSCINLEWMDSAFKHPLFAIFAKGKELLEVALCLTW